MFSSFRNWKRGSIHSTDIRTNTLGSIIDKCMMGFVLNFVLVFFTFGDFGW